MGNDPSKPYRCNGRTRRSLRRIDNGSVRGSEAMFSVFRFAHSQLKWVLCKSDLRLLFLVSAFVFICISYKVIHSIIRRSKTKSGVDLLMAYTAKSFSK